MIYPALQKTFVLQLQKDFLKTEVQTLEPMYSKQKMEDKIGLTFIHMELINTDLYYPQKC